MYESALSWLKEMIATARHLLPSPPEDWYWNVTGHLVAILLATALLALGGAVAGVFGPAAKYVACAPFNAIAIFWRVPVARWERRQQQKKQEEDRRKNYASSARELMEEASDLVRQVALQQNPEKPPPRVVYSVHDLPEGVTGDQVAWVDPGNVHEKERVGRRRVLVTGAECHFQRPADSSFLVLMWQPSYEAIRIAENDVASPFDNRPKFPNGVTTKTTVMVYRTSEQEWYRRGAKPVTDALNRIYLASTPQGDAILLWNPEPSI